MKLWKENKNKKINKIKEKWTIKKLIEMKKWKWKIYL